MAENKIERADFEIKGPVGIVYIENPGKLNALSLPVWKDLARIVDEVEQNRDINVLILTARGDHFSTGFDIDGIDDPVAIAERGRLYVQVLSKLQTLPVPVIVAARGFVFGGGLELALACDLVIASETAVFSLPEAQLGAFAPFAGIRLHQLVGKAKAKEIMMTCCRIPAKDALNLGLVNMIVADEELLEAAVKIGEGISLRGPRAIQLIKSTINSEAGGADASQCDGSQLVDNAAYQADIQEGVKAFFERRQPQFKSR